ncbi:MAG: acylphosphatase [Spirochaetaceae bacterium]|nr:MAG: acylphosphatase [Spirochaetaceae bacterium]
MPDHKAFRAVVHGRVQGVGFRYSARSMASRLGVHGFVRNEPDGSVYVEGEGSAAAVDAMIDWLRKGPPHAHVTDVDLRSTAQKGYSAFTVEA